MKRPRIFKNMNSARALFLIIWTVFVAAYLSFISGWGMGDWDAFRPSAYHGLTFFISQWIVLVTPYPLLIILPPIFGKDR